MNQQPSQLLVQIKNLKTQQSSKPKKPSELCCSLKNPVFLNPVGLAPEGHLVYKKSFSRYCQRFSLSRPSLEQLWQIMLL